MKKHHLLAVLFPVACFLLQGCITSSYDTAQSRDQRMESGTLLIPAGGLTREQVDVILSTQFPPDKPVSFALFYTPGYNYWGNHDYNPVKAIIRRLTETPYISRIVPVPEIIVPPKLTFEAIQQIGIRTLSEYSIIFYGNAGQTFFSYKSPAGHYMISSKLDFLIFDNRTTAIICSDTLFSEFQAPVEFFTDKGYRQAMEKMHEEQAAVLLDKMNILFKKQGN